MIQPLKDADGNYIPLDTWELYEDDGTAVDITGFAYVTRVGVWSASDFDGNILNPRQLHLNKPSNGMDELVRAFDEIAKSDEFRTRLKNAFTELKERCE